MSPTETEWQLTSFNQRFDAIKAQASFFQTAAGVRAANRKLLTTLLYADYDFTQQDAWTVLLDIRENPHNTLLDDHYFTSFVHWSKLFWREVETAFDELEAEVKKCQAIFDSYGLDKYGDEVEAEAPVEVRAEAQQVNDFQATQSSPVQVRRHVDCRERLIALTVIVCLIAITVPMVPMVPMMMGQSLESFYQ